ncbi:LEAF RUST 10 DISEASE-RESISTANCE LOCUS RECEPTOR-LIKE PROTEIN KINASE-like 1.1 isoform X1 [Citrus clementina]|uniref:LEAF RUST 10 DISEASE-RESISTANCE LOCUS RECEPTOR-LIKE PROTEIN KINASE-like 1.1 isoform X1 n=1 Tax=Citrus clementina TaxID=85681 RepID=UPI000CED5D43|nr:LEAF RUST 10 DISEASE-RESISTANCE LOCUS RECEPTOR-LIKE PROTEIN KINASE-like 1.1 isoform X1 [Citrus x clementina]
MDLSQISDSPLTSFCMFILCLLLARTVSGEIDRQYLACVTKTCGDGQNISFPFYIENQQEAYCGYPGFNLSCNDKGNPVLKLSSDTNYIVEKIVYDNHSVHVSNAAFSETNSDAACTFTRIKNVSLPAEFQLAPDQKQAVFLYNCNNSLPEKLLRHKLLAGNCSGDDTVLGMFEDDSDLDSASKQCKESAVAPVAVDMNGEGMGDHIGIEEMVRKGFLLKWRASDCRVCKESGGRCGFDADTFHFQCYCPDRPHAKQCTPGHKKSELKLGLGLGGGSIVLIALLSFWIVFYRKRQKYASANIHSGNNSSGPSSKSDLETGTVYFGVPIFSYSDLAEATNDFSREKELGDGGFGTVYYGKLKDGREVAVKRLYDNNYRRVEQFMNEVEILTRLRHKNLVSLFGCTSRYSQGLLLVYEFVANGTVADQLHGDRAKHGLLTWPIRMNIAIETASALAYLHASDIIHRDVKTNNILLDSNFCVKVADFGLSRLFPLDVTHVSTAPQGTPGYVDPEYHQCYQLTDKSDVYSFGVVLIELISSMPAVDMNRHRHEINLANLAINKIQKCAFDELIDPCLGFESDEEVKRMTTSVAELAFLCLQQDKELRPSMEEVFAELQRIKSGESKFENHEEKQDDSEGIKNTQPPPSPPYCDEDSLLKNMRLPPSPTSVTEKWVSISSTTPNASG